MKDTEITQAWSENHKGTMSYSENIEIPHYTLKNTDIPHHTEKQGNGSITQKCPVTLINRNWPSMLNIDLASSVVVVLTWDPLLPLTLMLKWAMVLGGLLHEHSY